ncbi:MAG: hypothetical protein AB7W59_20635, partial [Acidimicrobiia bacterium]
MVTTQGVFRERFAAALEAWQDSADASARFSTAVAAMTPSLRIGSEVEVEELIAAVRAVAERHEQSSTAMWSLLQRLALQDPVLTGALLEVMRRQLD